MRPTVRTASGAGAEELGTLLRSTGALSQAAGLSPRAVAIKPLIPAYSRWPKAKLMTGCPTRALLPASRIASGFPLSGGAGGLGRCTGGRSGANTACRLRRGRSGCLRAHLALRFADTRQVFDRRLRRQLSHGADSGHGRRLGVIRLRGGDHLSSRGQEDEAKLPGGSLLDHESARHIRLPFLPLR